MNRFTDRVVIITAAASGIGLATANRFAQEGARLVLADINMEGLETAAAGLGLPEDRISIRKVDVRNGDDVTGMVNHAVEHFGGIDVLINNAGVGALGYVTELEPEIWQRVIETTLTSVFYSSRAAIPHLAKRKGCIVNTASISGLFGDYGFAAYNAAKGGVVNLTRTLAIDHASDGSG